jgi:hypothetical protein
MSLNEKLEQKSFIKVKLVGYTGPDLNLTKPVIFLDDVKEIINDFLTEHLKDVDMMINRLKIVEENSSKINQLIKERDKINKDLYVLKSQILQVENILRY